jgi:hypothetical protein
MDCPQIILLSLCIFYHFFIFQKDYFTFDSCGIKLSYFHRSSSFRVFLPYFSEFHLSIHSLFDDENSLMNNTKVYVCVYFSLTKSVTIAVIVLSRPLIELIHFRSFISLSPLILPFRKYYWFMEMRVMRPVVSH